MINGSEFTISQEIIDGPIEVTTLSPNILLYVEGYDFVTQSNVEISPEIAAQHIVIEVEAQDQPLITPHVCEMTDFERADMANFYLEKTNDSIKIKNSLLCFNSFDAPLSKILVKRCVGSSCSRSNVAFVKNLLLDFKIVEPTLGRPKIKTLASIPLSESFTTYI